MSDARRRAADDRPAIRGVAFDLMDTLVRDPWRAALRAAFGPRLEAAMQHRDVTSWARFETGRLTEDEFWALHADWDPDPEACRRVRVEGTTWLPGMAGLVDEVAGLGLRTALASNYPSWFEDIDPALLGERFDEVVVSYRVGVRKPDAGFYAQVATRLGLAPDELVFVDDREANVQAAVEAGMHGVTFTDADRLRSALVDLGLGLDRDQAAG